MRYILFITGIFLLSVFPAIMQAQQKAPPASITIQMNNASVRDVLSEIEKQANVRFTYESSLLNDLPKISFNVHDEPLESCLKKLFLSLPVLYQYTGNYIILKKKPKQVTVSGFIRDNASLESLIGASVYDVSTKRGAASNNHGFFSVRLTPGDILLQVSYIGYKSEMFSLKQLDRDTTLIIDLAASAALQEVVVTGSNTEQQPVLSSQMGKMEVNQKAIKMTPTLFGEADIIKTLQLTPGVAAGTEGFTGMYVRGGNGDDNLFLIDGNPVYQISHVGGLFSAFNTDAVRGMDFYKAGFPARYGGRLSSVIDVHTKEGNMKEYHGSASIGLISGGLSFEGPIIKDKTSFMIALRRTWLDVLTVPALAIVNAKIKSDGDKVRARYSFHDLNLKLDHKLNERSRLFFSLYNGKDELRGGFKEVNTDIDRVPFVDDNHASLDWGNLLINAGWTHMFSNRLFGKISGVYTQYSSKIMQSRDYEYEEKGSEYYEKIYSEASSSTGIVDFGLRTSFDYYPSQKHHVRFGADALVHRFRPEYSKTVAEGTSVNMGAVFADDKIWGREFSAYVEDDWDITPAIKLNGGLRLALFNIDKTTYSSLEPRASLRWLLRDNISLKASYARMNQYVHLVSESYVNLPTDSWMPVTAKLKPMVSDQMSLGAYYNLNGDYDFSIEGYYKKMNNLLEYRDGYSILPTFSSWEEKLTSGEGRAYGAEFMVRKQTGNTTGWIGYTLSWADRKFEEINYGKRFPSKYDNRHKINIVVMHKLSSKVELTASWVYSSGNRATLSLENYEGMVQERQYHWNGEERVVTLESTDLDYVQERNNYQFVPYHRLDLGINIYRPKKSGNMGIWNISIYNAYSRMNPFMIYKGTKEIKTLVENPSSGGYGSLQYEYVPIFKTVGIMPIIPSITYTYKF